MKDEAKTTQQLQQELNVLHQEIAELKKSEATHKQTVEALRKSEEYFRAITQNSSDIIIIVDKIGTITYVNPSIERFAGYKPEELIGKSGFDFIALADLPRAIYDFGRSILTKDVIIPNAFRIKHKDGSERVLEGVGNNLLDNPVVAGFVMNVRDITERKKAEEELDLYRKRLENLVEERTSELANINSQLLNELTERQRAEKALRESEERFRALIQKSSDIISIFDEHGLFIYNSPSVEKVLGYSPEYLIGKSPFEFIHPDDHALVRKKFAEVINRTNTGTPTEFRFLKADGSWKSVESLGSNLLNYQGINGIVITSRDVTERKEAEEKRKLLEGRLHRAEKMESLGTLAGGVAHDLNNVLGVLVGYSELLLMEFPVGNPHRKHISSILQSSQRAAAIIQDLLTLARRGVAVSEVVDLNKVISDYFSAPEFEKLKAHHPFVFFNTHLEQDLLNIKGSPVHLQKTIMNLVSNASEAISAQGEVTVRTENRYLDTPIRGYDDVRDGDYVVLTVSDNGKGISATEIEKIFEPFYTKKVMGRSGTGLGLAVVWGTVKDHEGYINVQSEDGKGSTFTIYFPATRDELIRDTRKTSIEHYMGRGESILVVDDVMEQREMAASMLARLGYKVHTVSSGEEAIEFLKTHTMDLLVLDMIMVPGIDGLETYEQVLKINPHQRAVIVSGFSETDRVKKAQTLGAGAYVRKPYLLEKLGFAIRGELSKAAPDNS